MWPTKYFATIACAGAMVWMCGCSSLNSGKGTSAEEPPQNLGLSLSDEDTQFAEALAYFTQGLVHEFNHEYDEALDNYKQAVGRDPDNEELHFRIAMGLLQQKKNDEAIELMENLALRKPDSKKPRLWLALIYRATDQTEKALDTYESLIDLSPQDASLYIEAASLLMRNERDDEAIQVLEKGLGRVQDRLQILRLLAGIHVKHMSATASEDEASDHRKKAIKTLTRALEMDTADLSTLYQLGDLYILDRNLEKAIACFAAIEEKHPADLQIKQKLALSFIAIGDNQKAIESLEAFVSKDPSQGRVYYYLGELYQQMGQPEEALMNYRFAAKADPTDPAPFIKSALLQHEESPEESIKTLLEAIEHLPENARLHELLAYTYFGTEDHENATKYFARTLALKTSGEKEAKVTPNFYFSQCVSLQHLRRYDEAAESLVEAVQDNSSYLEAYLQYLFRSDDDDIRLDGISVLRKVGNKMANDARPQLYLGMAYSYLKRYGEAVDAYDRTVSMIEQAPERYEDLNSAMIYFWYAAACERDNQFDRAETLFHRCLEIDPEQAEAYNYLAYMWAEQGLHLERALEFVQKALEINPGSGAFIDTLGWVYFMQGRYEEALVEINRAADLIPDDPTIVDHLGDVLHQLGRTEEALPHWKQSFILEPENEKLSAKLESHGIDLEPLREEAEALANEVDQEEESGSPIPDASKLPLEPEDDAEMESTPLEEEGELIPLPET